MTLVFVVRQQTISMVQTNNQPRQGSTGYLRLRFNFTSSEWKSLRKTLYLSSGDYAEPYILTSDEFEVPAYYTQQSSFSLTLLGDSEDMVVPTDVVTVSLDPSNNLWEATPPDPQNSAYIQLLNQVNSFEGRLQKLENSGGFSDLPESLPNPHALHLTGAVEATYDGSVPVEVVIPQGGGGASPEVHPFEKMKATLIINKTITTDENGALPAKVSLSEDDNGNPLELTAFALQSDIKSGYSYTEFGINRIIGNAQAARGFFPIRKTHGRDDIANTVFVSEKGLTTVCGPGCNGIVPASFAYPYDGYKVREIVFPYSGSIASGTFVKVWKLSAEE